jgi:hypothetical protein
MSPHAAMRPRVRCSCAIPCAAPAPLRDQDDARVARGRAVHQRSGDGLTAVKLWSELLGDPAIGTPAGVASTAHSDMNGMGMAEPQPTKAMASSAARALVESLPLGYERATLLAHLEDGEERHAARAALEMARSASKQSMRDALEEIAEALVNKYDTKEFAAWARAMREAAVREKLKVPSPQQPCTFCGGTLHVAWVIEPYGREIHDVTVWRWMCGYCYQERRLGT